MHMESTKTKVEVMKPLIFKAAIPLSLSVFGFIFARFTVRRRRNSISKAFQPENQVNSLITNPHEKLKDEESSGTPDSISLCCTADEQSKEILDLRHWIEELQSRELKLESWVIQYYSLKEQESVLMELTNKLLLEMARVEVLGKEISMMEAESQRFEGLVVEYLSVLRNHEFSRKENKLLRGKVKKLFKKTERLSRVIREQNIRVEVGEEMISRNQEELERKDNVVKAMETEISELQNTVARLQEEKKELLDKLKVSEVSASSKIQTEERAMMDYNHLVNELEQLQQDRATESKELIYLRWSNACLRHQLMRGNQEQHEHIEEIGEKGDIDLEGELEGLSFWKGESRFNLSNEEHVTHPKKPKLIQKLKGWVGGSDQKMKHEFEARDEKHETKCFRRSLVFENAEELHLSSRNSYSSA